MQTVRIERGPGARVRAGRSWTPTRSTTATTAPRPSDVPVRDAVLGLARPGRLRPASRSKSCEDQGRAHTPRGAGLRVHPLPAAWADVLEGVTTVTDVYEKERSNGGKARVST